MSEFTIHSDSIDVEQIMDQIRARVQEKRGEDYTEAQIREMAGVKLERFLDPDKVRSDLVDHYRRTKKEQPSLVFPKALRKPPPARRPVCQFRHLVYSAFDTSWAESDVGRYCSNRGSFWH